jgi:hypothetical protein
MPFDCTLVIEKQIPAATDGKLVLLNPHRSIRPSRANALSWSARSFFGASTAMRR